MILKIIRSGRYVSLSNSEWEKLACFIILKEINKNNHMNQAVIKKLVSDKGFGFLTVEGRDKDLFFHASGLVEGLLFDDLKEGQVVTFQDVVNNGKGDGAVGIELA
jgi:CspA family cold shock protein